MTFLWIGLGYWMLVRTEERRDSAVWCALVIGLGTLIRPELILMSIVELAALGVVVSASGWKGPASITRRYLAPAAAAVALPLLYELWRMAYFALIVPNTALAKSAGASWWSQGFTYLWNFIAPYTLWLPFALAIPIVLPRLRAMVAQRRPDRGHRVDHPGCHGDGRHPATWRGSGAITSMPAFFFPGSSSLCLPIFVSVRQLRTLLIVPVVGIVAWSVACAGWLRFSTGGVLRSDHGIIDERAFWIAVSKSPHPVERGRLPQPARWLQPGGRRPGPAAGEPA